MVIYFQFSCTQTQPAIVTLYYRNQYCRSCNSLALSWLAHNIYWEYLEKYAENGEQIRPVPWRSSRWFFHCIPVAPMSWWRTMWYLDYIQHNEVDFDLFFLKCNRLTRANRKCQSHAMKMTSIACVQCHLSWNVCVTSTALYHGNYTSKHQIRCHRVNTLLMRENSCH